MFVRSLKDLEALGRIKYPANESFRSARFITAADELGFSYNENNVTKNTTLDVWLKHHWEANFIVSGKGTVTDLTSNQSWSLEPGVLYVVGPNDRHRLQFTEDECHISIFHPPLTGNEKFDSDGSYEASGPIEKTDRRLFLKGVDEVREENSASIPADAHIEVLPLLNEADDIGFELTYIRIKAGEEITIGDQLRHCANHIIAGTARLTDKTSELAWELGPSMTYSVAPDDQHVLMAMSDVTLLNVRAMAPL